MQLFCPACQSPFPGVSRCPRCGGLLLLPHEVSPDAPHRTAEAPPPARPTAVGRVAVGTVLTMGLYLALRKLATGGVLALDSDPAGWWTSWTGLAAIHLAQVLAVAFGAVVAAAGREQGSPLGLAVGAVSGGLFLGYELFGGAPPQDLVLYLQPPVLALFGLVAGTIGSRVWGAAPKLDMPMPNPSKLSSIRLMEDAELDRPRPTLWVRVMAGAAIMVAGVVVADVARNTAQKYSGGLLRVQTVAQAEFITLQLATLSIMLGAILAGSSTGAGIRHGLLVGLLGSVGILAACAKTGGVLPVVDIWLVQLSLDGLPLHTPAVLTGIAGSVMLLSVVGGWLGGTLFLPLAPAHMRRRLSIGMD